MYKKDVVLLLINSKIKDCYSDSKKDKYNKKIYFTTLRYLLELKKDIEDYL